MAISMMGYILVLIFPIYVNIYKKDSMDLHRNTEVNVKVPTAKELELEEGNQGNPTAANVESVSPQGL
jgi:FHS family L-fucose permease-like MFS transporter